MTLSSPFKNQITYDVICQREKVMADIDRWISQRNVDIAGVMLWWNRCANKKKTLIRPYISENTDVRLHAALACCCIRRNVQHR